MVSVSVIICTRNRASSLRETLASIGRCDVPADMPAELLVIDNGSTDETKRVVESGGVTNMPLRYVYEGRAGKGYAYNTGLAEGRGQVFLFTDDDVRVPANWIEGMVRPIVSDVADAVQGGVVAAPHLDRPWLKGVYREALALVEAREDREPESLVGANMAFRREVLERVPAFSVKLGPGASGLADDTLWGLQLRRAGYCLKFALDADVVHHFEPSRLDDTYFRLWAQKEGTSRALMDFHWLGRRPANPRITYVWTAIKLALRRLLTRRRHPVAPEWVVHYRARLAYMRTYVRLTREAS